MKRTLTITLDTDWIYRRAMPLVFQNMFSVIWKIDRIVRNKVKAKLNVSFTYLAGKNNRLSGMLSINHPIGSMALWIVVVLAMYLFLSFIK